MLWGMDPDREKKHRDALRKYMGKTAGEVMTAPALTVDVSDSLEKVGNMMFNKQIKRVFVTDDKKLVGVVSRSAFTKLMLKDDEA
jgi:CBS domain-containing protein